MRKLVVPFLLAALVIPAAVAPASAQEWHGRGGFHDHGFDHERWRGGSWYNGFHEGRNGWWWIVDGSWYFYPAPIYPYPDPYIPPTVVMETTAAPAAAAPEPADAPRVYYYCASPAGYYPEVPSCPGAWQKVDPPAHQAPAAEALPAGSEHDIDAQQLNVFAARFHAIDPNDEHARAKLKTLEKQVEDFRQSLYQKDYNAMDVLRNAEDLKQRIDKQREWLATHKGQTPPPEASAPVPQQQ